MFIPKKYGQSKVSPCPFCEKNAIRKNTQGVPVCEKHGQETLAEYTCLCKSPLELRLGKFGPYFNCLKCGNQNFKRVLELNAVVKPKPAEPARRPEQESHAPKGTGKEITITTNDAEWFD